MSTAADNPRRFLDPQVISRIAGLDVRAKHVVEGYIAGMHRSPFLGHSVEFAQHREYVAGDDLRHLDWKVWSKTDKLYVKQFEEETNFRCQIVVDVSESMHYGRGPLNKYDYACTLAASLAYLVVRQMDSVGLATFDEAVRTVLPTRSSQAHLDAIVNALHVSKPREKTDLNKILRRVAETFQQRSVVVLVSDLLADREPLIKGLEMLRHRRHDVLIFHVMDDDELNFPFAGTTRFEGMEGMPDLLCDPRSLRDGYLEALEEYLADVRRACSRLGIDYLLTQTGDSLDAALSTFLRARSGTKGGKAASVIL